MMVRSLGAMDLTTHAPAGTLLSGEISAARRPPPKEPGAGNLPTKAAGEGAAAARVLVVEDEYFVGLELEVALQEAGYEVVAVVVSSDEAIAAAAAARPDIIVMDVRLIGARDGVDAAIEIRRRFDIGSLFVTAYSDPATKARADAAKPVGWLSKPITGGALVAALKDVLKGR